MAGWHDRADHYGNNAASDTDAGRNDGWRLRGWHWDNSWHLDDMASWGRWNSHSWDSHSWDYSRPSVVITTWDDWTGGNGWWEWNKWTGGNGSWERYDLTGSDVSLLGNGSCEWDGLTGSNATLLWANYHNIGILVTPVLQKPTVNIRATNQCKANENWSRTVEYKLREAITDCPDFQEFDYHEWLEKIAIGMNIKKIKKQRKRTHHEMTRPWQSLTHISARPERTSTLQ